MSSYMSQGTKAVIKPPILTIVGFTGSGKEQPVSSIVQCPEGERTIGELKVDDYVIGKNGKKTKVTGIYPQGVKDVYEITFSDGFSAKCGLDHLWTVINGRGYVKTLSTGDMINSFSHNCGVLKYKIPLCEPVEFNNYSELDFDPYLIGVLIGDGYLCGDTVSFSVAKFDHFIFEKVKPMLHEYKISIRSTGTNVNQYNICSGRQNKLKEHIRDIGLNVKSKHRFIPAAYKYLSVGNRIRLLNGLMDTDGSCSKNRTSYSTKSEALADDICWLVQSLGGIAIKRVNDRTKHGKGIEYSVNVKTFFNPFSLERKAKEWKLNTKNRMSRKIRNIKKLDYQEKSVCIKVDAIDELYLTNNFIVTHNTSLSGLFPKPAFIQAEDSQTVFQRVPVELQPHFNPPLPRPHRDKKGNTAKNVSTREVLIEQLMEFYTEDHPFETLVIDTATVINDLFEEEMVEFYPGVTSSIQDAAGGFQKAFDTIAKWHDDIINKCKKIRDKRNMAIVFLAHSSERKKKNSPDVSGEYTVYSMRMHKKSEDVYISHSDAILYLKQTETMTGHVTDNKGNTTKRGRVRISDERVLITSSDGTVGYVSAKNRYDMPQEISVPKGTNPILQYIPFYKDYVEQNGLYVSQEQDEAVEE